MSDMCIYNPLYLSIHLKHSQSKLMYRVDGTSQWRVVVLIVDVGQVVYDRIEKKTPNSFLKPQTQVGAKQIKALNAIYYIQQKTMGGEI